jgi:hypothetical protein
MKNCDLFCGGRLPSGLLFIYLITCQYQIIALKGANIQGNHAAEKGFQAAGQDKAGCETKGE